VNIDISDRAKKQLKRLPAAIKKKTYKSFSLLASNYRHPSLRSRKMAGQPHYEARIDYHYRFIFAVQEDIIKILVVGPHDEGLGKK